MTGNAQESSFWATFCIISASDKSKDSLSSESVTSDLLERDSLVLQTPSLFPELGAASLSEIERSSTS